MAKPKSASLTAAPLALLANNKFSGCKTFQRTWQKQITAMLNEIEQIAQ